jgi:hypothetical protein
MSITTTKLNLARDVQGYNLQSMKFPTDIFTSTVPEASSIAVTTPSNFENWLAVISPQYGSEIWVALNTAATVPAGNTFASSTSVLLNPYYPFTFAFQVVAGDTLNFYSVGATADVSVAFYALAQTN